MKLGATWFIISRDWYKSWKEYVRFDSHNPFGKKAEKPGVIDNSKLIELSGSTIDLKPRLFSGHDYETVPEQVWNQLIEWLEPNSMFFIHFFLIFFFSIFWNKGMEEDHHYQDQLLKWDIQKERKWKHTHWRSKSY